MLAYVAPFVTMVSSFSASSENMKILIIAATVLLSVILGSVIKSWLLWFPKTTKTGSDRSELDRLFSSNQMNSLLDLFSTYLHVYKQNVDHVGARNQITLHQGKQLIQAMDSDSKRLTSLNRKQFTRLTTSFRRTKQSMEHLFDQDHRILFKHAIYVDNDVRIFANEQKELESTVNSHKFTGLSAIEWLTSKDCFRDLLKFRFFRNGGQLEETINLLRLVYAVFPPHESLDIPVFCLERKHSNKPHLGVTLALTSKWNDITSFLVPYLPRNLYSGVKRWCGIYKSFEKILEDNKQPNYEKFQEIILLVSGDQPWFKNCSVKRLRLQFPNAKLHIFQAGKYVEDVVPKQGQDFSIRNGQGAHIARVTIGALEINYFGLSSWNQCLARLKAKIEKLEVLAGTRFPATPPADTQQDMTEKLAKPETLQKLQKAFSDSSENEHKVPWTAVGEPITVQS